MGTMLAELDKQMKFGSNLNENYNMLYCKYVKQLNMNTMLLWNVNDVVQWIFNLENGRFAKYKSVLSHTLTIENVNGANLIAFGHADLYRLGVEDADDQAVIINHIRKMLSGL